MGNLTYYTSFYLVETCGAPKIANIMENRTAKPGDQITFNCKVNQMFGFSLKSGRGGRAGKGGGQLSITPFCGNHHVLDAYFKLN